jgi:hypothetical protein
MNTATREIAMSKPKPAARNRNAALEDELKREQRRGAEEVLEMQQRTDEDLRRLIVATETAIEKAFQKALSSAPSSGLPPRPPADWLNDFFSRSRPGLY